MNSCINADVILFIGCDTTSDTRLLIAFCPKQELWEGKTLKVTCVSVYECTYTQHLLPWDFYFVSCLGCCICSRELSLMCKYLKSKEKYLHNWNQECYITLNRVGQLKDWLQADCLGELWVADVILWFILLTFNFIMYLWLIWYETCYIILLCSQASQCKVKVPSGL